MDSNSPRKRPRSESGTSQNEPRKSLAKNSGEDLEPVNSRPGRTYDGIRAKGDARIQNGDIHNNNHFHGTVHQHSARGDFPGDDETPRKKFVDFLAFPAMEKRYKNVKQTHGDSCRWLFDTREWLDWRDRSKFSDHHGFLWIKGKAGVGKSTMMKFALHTAQKKFKDHIILYYFFNARSAAELQKSVCGMFRTLLCQLFEKLPERILETLSLPRLNSHNLRLGALKDLFSLIIENLGTQPVTCFIDALDECKPNEIRDLVRLFEDFGNEASTSGVELYTCLSSRFYPHQTMSRTLHLTLERQAGHDADIAKYIDERLQIDDSESSRTLKDKIKQKASHVFLWVHLVVEILNEEHDRGNVHMLQERLEEIPEELKDLFREIIRKDERRSDKATLIFTLQWILYAKRPLTYEELYFAIRSRDGVIASDQSVTEQVMRKFVLNSSRGLAEITIGERQTVQFIHETVRQFLSGNRGLRTLDTRLAENLLGVSHNDLKRCCESYTYLKPRCSISPGSCLTNKFRPDHEECYQRLAEEYPFLQYALHGLLFHANAAAEHDLCQRGFVKRFEVAKWICLHQMAENSLGRRSRYDHQEIPKEYIFADLTLNGLLECELKEGKGMILITITAYYTALGAAVTHGNETGVKLLLKGGADPMSPVTRERTVFDLSVRKGNSKIFHDLLRYVPRKVRFDAKTSGRRLYAAAYEGHYDIFQTLVKDTTDINAWDSFRSVGWPGKVGSPLQAASLQGHRNIVQSLIDHGADVNFDKGTNGSYGPPLVSACCRGHRDVVKLLLEHGAHLKELPLHAAVNRGNIEVATLLIAAGVKKDENHEILGTALHLVAAKGDVKMVRFLLSKQVNPDPASSQLGTPLLVASARGHNEVVEILLAAGAEPDRISGHWGTPLHLAAHNGFLGTAELLIKSGANVNMVGGTLYRSALRAASTAGHNDIVRMLLYREASIDFQSPRIQPLGNEPRKCFTKEVMYPGWVSKLCSDVYRFDLKSSKIRSGAYRSEDRFRNRDFMYQTEGTWRHDFFRIRDSNPDGQSYGTALHEAAWAGHEQVVAQLLNHGADLNIIGGHHHTALKAAIKRGNWSIVELLLSHGAADFMSLYEAASGNHCELTKRLLDRGVDANAWGKHRDEKFDAIALAEHWDMLELLLRHGAKGSKELLRIAANRGRGEIIRIISKQESRWKLEQETFNVMMEGAKRSGQDKVVEALFEYADAKVLAQDTSMSNSSDDIRLSDKTSDRDDTSDGDDNNNEADPIEENVPTAESCAVVKDSIVDTSNIEQQAMGDVEVISVYSSSNESSDEDDIVEDS